MLRKPSALKSEAASRFACSIAIHRIRTAAPAGVLVALEQSVRVLTGPFRLAHALFVPADHAPIFHAQFDPAQLYRAPFALADLGRYARDRAVPSQPFLARPFHVRPARGAVVRPNPGAVARLVQAGCWGILPEIS